MLGNVNLPLRIQHLLVRPDNAEHDLLVHRLGGGGGAFLEQIGAVDLLLHLEGIERYPLPGEACGKVPDGLRKVQSVQGKIGLRELSLPKTGAESIDRVVAPRDVFSKAELRQQLRACQARRRLRIQIASARNRCLGALPQGLIDGLPERQRFLRTGGQSPHREQEKKAQISIKA